MLAHFLMMDGNRKSGLISLRKADKSGVFNFLLIFTLANFVIMNGKGKSGLISLVRARFRLLKLICLCCQFSQKSEQPKVRLIDRSWLNLTPRNFNSSYGPHV